MTYDTEILELQVTCQILSWVNIELWEKFDVELLRNKFVGSAFKVL